MHKIPKQPRQSQFCGGSKSRIASIVLLPFSLPYFVQRKKKSVFFSGENKVQQMKREWDGWKFLFTRTPSRIEPINDDVWRSFWGPFFSVPRTSARKSKVILFMWCVCGIALRNKRERERAAYTQSFRFFPHSYSKRRPFLIFCVVPQRRKEKA